MTTLAETTAEPVILTPSDDPTPVERAVVTGMADEYDPETFLDIQFHLTTGGIRCWYAWTTGGDRLGDQADHDALSRGLDFADWTFLLDRYRTERRRGRIVVYAYPLRPIHADVLAGDRTTEAHRDRYRGLARFLADRTGQPAPDAESLPEWFGVGPALLANHNRRTR